MMRVLVYTSLFPNHLHPNHAIFVKKRMFHFAKLHGCSIKVVAPIPYCPPWPILGHWHYYSQIQSYEVLEGVDIFHPRYLLIPKISMMLHGLSMFLSSIRLMRKIDSHYHFDIIDAHYVYPDGFAAVLLAKLLRKPVVLSARGSDINEFAGYKFIKPMLRYALSNADHIVSVCKALKEEMSILAVDDTKISVIPNGVNLERFVLEDRKEARDKLGIERSRKILLSVGWLIPRKGIQVTLEALPLVIQQYKDIDFYVVGEGPYRQELERLIDKFDLRGKVYLVGEKANSELNTWYNAADVFCLASSREGWANVIMESLACGTPVVATNVWGAPEIITSRHVGILVDRSPGAIASGVIEAFSRNWDRVRIRSHIMQNTWDNVALEVKNVLSAQI